MKAKIIKISEQSSRYGGIFYFVFFKGEDGKSYRTCLYPEYRNFARWSSVLKAFPNGEVWLDGLIVRANKQIDADSNFKICERGEYAEKTND